MYQVPVPQTAMIPIQSYPIQQYLVPVMSNKKRALVLICFGIALLVVSTILCCWCIWIVSVDFTIYVVYLALTSSIYHIILSVFAILGGKDTVKRRCIVVTCLGFAIFGICVVVLTNLIFTFVSWSLVSYNCRYCDQTGKFYPSCYDSICINIVLIFLPVAIFVALQGIFDISISIVNCHNICQCTTSGSIVQPPFYQNGQTQQLAFINPQYTFQQPYDPSFPPTTQDPAIQVPNEKINSNNNQ